MSLPRFTAETSLYKSNVTYQLDSSCGKVLTQGVTPQSPPPDLQEIRCRYGCRTAFTKHRNVSRLQECLNEC
jgi:hypothetical protein